MVRERKKHSAEQVVSLLRQIEVAVANGKTPPLLAAKPASPIRHITAGGGLQVDHAIMGFSEPATASNSIAGPGSCRRKLDFHFRIQDILRPIDS